MKFYKNRFTGKLKKNIITPKIVINNLIFKYQLWVTEADFAVYK